MPQDESQRDEQARIVDKLLKQLPHANPTLSDVDRRPRAESVKRTPTSHPTNVGASKDPARPSALAVWGRVGVGILLAVAITQWPYSHACGWPLLGYGTAVTLVGVAGVWCGVFSWRGHTAVPHLIALVLVAWWAVLTAGIVLPRSGYAQQQASWFCGDDAAPSGSGVAETPTLPPIQAAPAEAVQDSVVVDSTVSPNARRDTTTTSVPDSGSAENG